ncbi:hypothetical protein CEE36_06645 [candidate division TA06 bacterium B3_TA06]|uniref:Uncharacterized protein n=1 Tax=candidate division TA06 bacterium B3_TA06 TaxID=2012487 RepID=A0A532V718_UNCT6|nr:MAG: hypothetical protein CEE36_06645 [candidate division TA06 bacterium B3_TA06]
MKEYPPLVYYRGIDEYRNHYIHKYCNRKIYTFFGMRVFFPRGSFEHLFYESSKKLPDHKDTFARDRAERIDWIAAALQDRDAEIFQGWDRVKKRIDPTRLVFVVQSNYIVVVKKEDWDTGVIRTAFLAKPWPLQMIKSKPRVQIPKKKDR